MRGTSIGLGAVAALAMRVVGPAWEICGLAVIATALNFGAMGTRANAAVVGGTITGGAVQNFQILSPPPAQVGAGAMPESW